MSFIRIRKRLSKQGFAASSALSIDVSGILCDHLEKLLSAGG